ncbi:LamG-like jellyroll fold domain-containing protein [Geodermatophilus sp. URMC 64]
MTEPASWRTGWPALVASTAARVVLGALALLVAVSVLLPLVAGWQSSVVMSGSMAPTLVPGDVVVVRPVDTADLAAGDVVLVDDPDVPGELRLHRIADVEPDGLRLRGDASATPDSSLVDPAAVHGVGTLRLPALGSPALWIAEGRTAPLVLTGLALAGLVALALLHRGPAEEPRRRMPARPIALAAAAVALLALPGAADARAVFSASTGTPGNSFTAGSHWSCAGAASTSGASQYYGLQETAGPTATNTGSAGTAANGTYSSTGVTYGVAGPRCGTGEPNAVQLDGSTGQMWTTRAVTNPTTFSLQIWFATTTTRGGKLIGFGDGANGATSGSYDRHLYMSNSGQLVFGVWDGTARILTSPAAYNDGRWHLATATFSGTSGTTLYVDGVQVGRDVTATVAWNYTAYWRVGYDNLNGWPNAPASFWFAGSLAHAAVFPAVLSATEVANQYGAGPWTCATAAGASGAAALQYYGLQETTGPTATNAGSAGAGGDGTYSAGGVTYGVAGPDCGPGGSSAVRLDGASGYLWTTKAYTAPQTFSVQIWFATMTTTGGKLIGFGAGVNGALSYNYDRHIYMTNTGQLVFGVYDGATRVITTPSAYNDGRWHFATATYSPPTGMAFYVDGALIGTNTSPISAENFTGYWRVGYDNLNAWPSPPTSNYFAGSVAHAAVFDRVLPADEVTGQYTAGR